LDRLQEANVIYSHGRSWRVRSLRKCFAVKRLVAIEAKLDNWRRGFKQAVKNTWFASESYLLLPTVPCDEDVVELARKFGVGVLLQSRPVARPVVRATEADLPRSYASWLFNEWVWKICRTMSE
jgi:hypothetical protein